MSNHSFNLPPINRSQRLIIILSIFVLTLMACSLGTSSASPTPNIPLASTPIEATLPPIAPTAAITSAPIATDAPLIGVATATPVTGTDIITLTPTIEGTPNGTAEATQTTLTSTVPPVSSGPLDFTVNVTGCRADPSREGGVILTIRFNPVGGNGVYRFYDDDVERPQVYDRPATKGSGVIAAFRVESGDGQKTNNVKIQFKVNDYCH